MPATADSAICTTQVSWEARAGLRAGTGYFGRFTNGESRRIRRSKSNMAFPPRKPVTRGSQFKRHLLAGSQ